MNLKKIYKHNNRKQIWRILPTENKKLVIEERDLKSKEVFFTCLNIDSGKKIFKELQLEEKHWIGIESIYYDIIFFHTYGKPDMPAHKSIIAFDITSQSVLWQNDNFVFSFVYNHRVYCYQQRFESRVFFALDYLTGNILEEFGSDALSLNQFKEKLDSEFDKQNYLFPIYLERSDTNLGEAQSYLKKMLMESVIKGQISYLIFGELLLFNYHEVSRSNTLNNIFSVVDLTKNKILLKETLDKNLVSLMPESFFIKDNFLFLIVDKVKLIVYQLIE